MKTYYDRIRELREDEDISQERLAELLNLRQNASSQYELHKRRPDPETIIALAKFFNVSTDYLLGVTNIKNKFPER